MIRMVPAPPGNGRPGEGSGTREQQDPEAPAASIEGVEDDQGRSGRAFVVVMGLLFVVIAVVLTLASRSLSASGHTSTGTESQMTSTEP